jgi:hypothetical protein
MTITRTRTAVAAAFLLTTVAACGTAAPSVPPTGSGTRTASPSAPTTLPSPTIAGLQHATGATDILLRFEEGGGFVPVEFMATSAPSFTLYGDGTVVFRDPTAQPPAAADGVVRSNPFKTVRLDEKAIQALLNEALGPGALAIAKGPYVGHGADVPIATFTISIAGQTKQVSVTGLSPEMHDQDKALITALAGFAQQLDVFGTSLGSRPYEPTAYRAVLVAVDQPFGAVLDWPWTDLTPADFTNGHDSQLRIHAMTPAQVGALGIGDVAGGVSGITLKSNGKAYLFSLRPLLPDEQS